VIKPLRWTRHNQTTTSDLKSKISQTGQRDLVYKHSNLCGDTPALETTETYIQVRLVVSLPIKNQLNTLKWRHAFYCLHYTILNVFRLVSSYNKVGKMSICVVNRSPYRVWCVWVWSWSFEKEEPLAQQRQSRCGKKREVCTRTRDRYKLLSLYTKRNGIKYSHCSKLVYLRI
jgi:hypothetical protein